MANPNEAIDSIEPTNNATASTNTNYQAPTVDTETQDAAPPAPEEAPQTPPQGAQQQQQQPEPSNGDEDAPPPPPTPMTIKFKEVGGNELAMRMKPATKLKKAMDTYAHRQGKEIRSLRFLVDGVRVLEEHTPQFLEMEDGDTIEVHTEQIGGGY